MNPNMKLRNSRNLKLPALLLAGLMLSTPMLGTAQDAPPPPPGEAGQRGPHGGDHGRGEHGPRGGGPMMGPFMHELHDLDLTTAQRDSMKNAMKAAWTSASSSRTTLETLHRKAATTTPDSPDYASLVNQMADAEANAARDRVQRMAALKTEVFAMLTSAQKAQLAEKLKNLPEPPARPEHTGFRGR